MKKNINIAVRDLVEYSLRSGDLDLTLFAGESLLKAIRAHQSIQKSRPEEYTSEVSIDYEIATGNYIIRIRGRIDGIYHYPQKIIIDEIKTTGKPLSHYKEKDNIMHWGQAKCYAFIYASQNNLNTIIIQLSYYNLESKEREEIRKEFTLDELSSFFNDLIKSYLSRADNIYDFNGSRDDTIRKIMFPYEKYRPGQKEMIDRVYAILKDQSDIFIQAPTGIGKTMAVLLPAIQAIPDQKKTRIFFLTARGTGRNTAEDSIDILRQKGLKIKHLSLTAKDKICFNPQNSCNGQDCKYAQGFYDRINQGIQEAFNIDDYTRERIIELSERFRLCPFEFSLELALFSDIIICDYNYVFDPRVYLRRFFDNTGGDKNIILIDEAHNLIDRSRESYSAGITKKQVLKLRRELKDHLLNIYKCLGKLNNFFLNKKKEIPEGISTIIKEDYSKELIDILWNFVHLSENWLKRNEPSPFRQNLLDFYFNARRLINTSEIYNKGYKTYYYRKDNNLMIRLFCIDPSDQLKLVLEKCSSCIFFSATLSPIDYFKRLLGCNSNTPSIQLPSPFPKENLSVQIAGKISVLYKHRELTKFQIAKLVKSFIKKEKGKYLVFFPSYQYMKMILDIFDINEDLHLIEQKANMTDSERQEYLDHFLKDSRNNILGFAVMGGFFGESIDLVGDRLTGAVIIGTGFPKVSIERELIKQYFDEHSQEGLEFAYQIPGMIKVLQASGRVIRSETDKGRILLIDTRYLKSPYRDLLPRDWKPLFLN